MLKWNRFEFDGVLVQGDDTDISACGSNNPLRHSLLFKSNIEWSLRSSITSQIN